MTFNKLAMNLLRTFRVMLGCTHLGCDGRDDDKTWKLGNVPIKMTAIYFNSTAYFYLSESVWKLWFFICWKIQEAGRLESPMESLWTHEDK